MTHKSRKLQIVLGAAGFTFGALLMSGMFHQREAFLKRKYAHDLAEATQNARQLQERSKEYLGKSKRQTSILRFRLPTRVPQPF